MMEIPTFSQYDGKKAKTRCSIQWVITQARYNHFSRSDLEHVFECDGGLKKTVAALLCSGDPYCRITQYIFDTKEQLCSHEDVIQILCRKGLYVLDDADSLITAQDLRRMPLDLSSHLTIIDMLMFAFITHKLTSINMVVSTVRKFSEFSASRELPDNLEEAFILWLNKVSRKVERYQSDALESDKNTFGQPREENFEFPIIRNLTEDLFDGRSISLLLHYYCPSHISYQDISVKDPISIADAWHNLTQSLNFCNNILLPPSSADSVSSTILHPVDFLYSGQEMKTNIMVFLGTLFHYLENDPLEDVVSPLGHTVVCTRKGETSCNADVVSSVPEMKTFSITSNDDRRQQTLIQANHIVPGVQPLISNATKRSFTKPNFEDTDSVSTITINGSENYSSPIPFSSKPLLVRRNRDIHAPQPSSASKLFQKSGSDHFPVLKQKDVSDNNYTSDDGTSASGRSYPVSKSSSYQGLLSNGESNTYDRKATVVNKWHFRTPVQDLRNTNTSNNILIAGYHTPISNQLHPKHAADSTTFQETDSELLSNVEMDSDHDEKIEPGRTRLHGLGDGVPSSGDKISWSTFEIHKTFNSPKVAQSHNNANDLILETARTSEYDNSARSMTDDSEDMSDLTSVSSRTNSDAKSSNEAMHQESVRTNRKDFPNVINAEISPEIPRNITYVKPKSTENAEIDSGFTPFSQKSYTVQNENFHTVDSARAAGYPVIEPSPDRQHSVAASHLKSPGSHLKQPILNTENGMGDIKTVRTHKAPAQDHIVVGGTVVKLRNSQRRSTDRSLRNAKATSWMDQTKKAQNFNQPTEERRRHSNIPYPDKLAVTLKKLEERRKFIETERRRIEDRKKFIEEEKRRKEREWSNEFEKLQKEMDELNLEKQRDTNQECLLGDQPRHQVATFHKNEETSSDYSSKSPSPSSMNNHNNVETTECDNKLMQQIIDQHKNLNESPQSQSHNFFASPLSTTAYHIQKPGHSNQDIDQSFEQNRSSLVGHSTHDQKLTFNVTENTNLLQPGAQVKNMYNMPQQGISESTTNKENAGTMFLKNKSPNLRNETYAVDETFQQRQQNQEQTPVINNTHMKNIDHNANGQDMQHMTYDVSTQLADITPNPPEEVPQKPRIHTENHQPLLVQHGLSVKPPEVNILQPLSSEHSTRRSLFPGGGNQDLDTSAEQENIDPNYLGVGRADQTTYDSFSCKISSGSNHSTPHKMSPVQEIQGIGTPTKENNEEDMSDVLQKTADTNRRGGQGFELVDDTTPNTDIAKKKEQFLLKQLKKEEELKKKRADRENETEKRKEEARLKQEEVEAKKFEENQKRQQRLEEYKKRKLQQEEAQLVQQSSAIFSGGSSKKHSKQESTPHGTRLDKLSGSGRSSPATECNSVHNANNTDQGTTFIANPSIEQASVKPFRTRKMSGGRKDWDNESASSSAVSSDYTGPKLYKQPSSKSNKHIVYNAICHCCLPGKVNESLRNNTIQALEMCDARHFMILFRDAKCQYRALYTYDPDGGNIHRLSGNGPKDVVPSMIERLFKYNSGRKAFAPLPSKTLSVSIDAITIKNSFWQSNKKTSVLKK